MILIPSARHLRSSITRLIGFLKLSEFTAYCQPVNDWECFVDHLLHFHRNGGIKVLVLTPRMGRNFFKIIFDYCQLTLNSIRKRSKDIKKFYKESVPVPNLIVLLSRQSIMA